MKPKKLLLFCFLLCAGSVFAQEGPSCKAYFQVLQAKPGNPGLRAGLDSTQKRWWEQKGQKQYPGLCLSGSVASGDKPRYLVIWSKAKSIGPSSLAPNEIYGQASSALQMTAPVEYIYQPRMGIGSVTILNVAYDGSLELPPVYLAPANTAVWVVWPDSPKLLQAVVKYLAQEPALSAKLP